MTTVDTWELASYVVTVIGLPLAIFVFLIEQRRERENEEQEVYQLLSDNYQEFLRTALQHPDLKLFSADETPELTSEQQERMFIVFNMLVSLFERAFLLLYDENMTEGQRRRWSSWEDYMREWCRRADFRRSLSALLRGEDPEFAAYLRDLERAEQLGAHPNVREERPTHHSARAGVCSNPPRRSSGNR